MPKFFALRIEGRSKRLRWRTSPAGCKLGRYATSHVANEIHTLHCCICRISSWLDRHGHLGHAAGDSGFSRVWQQLQRSWRLAKLARQCGRCLCRLLDISTSLRRVQEERCAMRRMCPNKGPALSRRPAAVAELLREHECIPLLTCDLRDLSRSLQLAVQLTIRLAIFRKRILKI